MIALVLADAAVVDWRAAWLTPHGLGVVLLALVMLLQLGASLLTRSGHTDAAASVGKIAALGDTLHAIVSGVEDAKASLAPGDVEKLLTAIQARATAAGVEAPVLAPIVSAVQAGAPIASVVASIPAVVPPAVRRVVS